MQHLQGADIAHSIHVHPVKTDQLFQHVFALLAVHPALMHILVIPVHIVAPAGAFGFIQLDIRMSQAGFEKPASQVKIFVPFPKIVLWIKTQVPG